MPPWRRSRFRERSRRSRPTEPSAHRSPRSRWGMGPGPSFSLPAARQRRRGRISLAARPRELPLSPCPSPISRPMAQRHGPGPSATGGPRPAATPLTPTPHLAPTRWPSRLRMNSAPTRRPRSITSRSRRRRRQRLHSWEARGPERLLSRSPSPISPATTRLPGLGPSATAEPLLAATPVTPTLPLAPIPSPLLQPTPAAPTARPRPTTSRSRRPPLLLQPDSWELLGPVRLLSPWPSLINPPTTRPPGPGPSGMAEPLPAATRVTLTPPRAPTRWS